VKRVLRSAIVGLVIALAYLAWVRMSRRSVSQEFERQVQERETAKYRGLLPSYGTEVKILQFYVSRREVAKGDSTLVCYGVDNTRSVRIEPLAEPLIPLPGKCVAFAPKRTTTLKLVAEGTHGGEATRSLTVRVEDGR
jgi:hypothetical protein